MWIFFLHLALLLAVAGYLYYFLKVRLASALARCDKADDSAQDAERYPAYERASLLDRIAERLYVRMVFEHCVNHSPASIADVAAESYRLADALIEARGNWRNV
jgi:hypothetical protein